MAGDGMDISGYAAGDAVKMKKVHPCGSYEWTILRMGADVWLKCQKCGRQVIVDRDTFYKRVKGAREKVKANIAALEINRGDENL